MGWQSSGWVEAVTREEMTRALRVTAFGLLLLAIGAGLVARACGLI
jgi:hypothetical protein